RLRAFERALPTTQCHRLHGRDAKQPDREDEYRHHDLDEADSAHGRRGAQCKTTPPAHPSCPQHAPPPPFLADATPPPNLSVISRMLSGGFATGMHAVSVCWASTVPDGRKTISSTELWTSTPPGNSNRRITAGSSPVPPSCFTITWPQDAEPVQSSEPSVPPHTVTTRFRRMASDFASWRLAVSSSLAPARRLVFTKPTMLGTATVARIPTTATVTISSTRVKPRASGAGVLSDVLGMVPPLIPRKG